MRTSKLLGLVAAAALGASCAPGAKEDTEEAVTVQSGINSSAACFNTPAASTFLGGGSVLTPDNYNPSTCPRAYMIELRSYSSTYTMGTYAASVGATPTTQADCESSVLNTYVWRKDGTFLGSNRQRGAWTPDIRGVRHCAPPAVNIDYVIPGYKWGGDYKIALQAGSNAIPFQKISFATVKAPTASTVFDEVSKLTTTLNSVTGGGVHPAVQQVFNAKGTVAMARLCRQTQLDQALSQFTNQALIRAGASPQVAVDRDGGLSSIYTALCTSSGTATGLQSGLKQYGSAMSLALDGVRTATAGVARSDAAKVIAGVMRQAIGKLITNCGLKETTLLSYVYDGTLPAGKTGDNLLMGSCSGTPLQVSGSLGVGTNFSGDTLTQARDRFAQCLTQAGQQRCNDPRAGDAPDDASDPPPPPATQDDKCLHIDADTGEEGPCTQDDDDKSTEQASERYGTTDVLTGDAAKAFATQIQVDSDTALAAAAKQTMSVAGNDIAFLAATGAIVVAVATGGTGAILVAYVAWVGTGASAASAHCDASPQACGQIIREFTTPAPGTVFRLQCDGFGNCLTVQSSPPLSDRRPSSGNKMCAPDFDTGGAGWYETDGPPGTTRELSQDDRLLHCTCELLDAKYGGRSSTLAVSAGCPNAEEKARQDCVAQPDPRSMPNPDASPVKPECLAALSPPTNLVTRQTRICNAVLCGSGEMRMTHPDGTCGCVTVINDSAQGLPCTNGNFAMCTGDDPNSNTCGCPPLNPGPLGNDPLCQYIPNNTNWPGLLSGFSVVNRADVFPSVIGTQQFAMVKPNKSLVGPTIFTRSLTKTPAASTSNPPKLRLNALISKKPPTGGNIDLQIYITSRGTPSGTMPLTHDFAGQVRLNNLAAGTGTQVDIPLFAGSSQATMLNRAFGGKSLNIEYTLQAPSGYTRYIGVGAQDFVGASTSRPSTDVAAVCLPPTPTDPIGPVLIPNPLAPLATPSNPGTFTLSNGNLTLLSDRVPVLRTITQP